MTADAFIQCRVTPEVKALVRRLAEREGITESLLVKQLLDVVLRTAASGETQAPGPPGKVSRDARVYVRLPAEDWRLLRERSSARGIASATYVSLLVRSHLRGAAPIPRAEYLALRHSILELAAIGRHLNQITRVLNQDGRGPAPGRQEVQAMLKVAEGLRDHFRVLLSANERSWRDGCADTPR